MEKFILLDDKKIGGKIWVNMSQVVVLAGDRDGSKMITTADDATGARLIEVQQPPDQIIAELRGPRQM